MDWETRCRRLVRKVLGRDPGARDAIAVRRIAAAERRLGLKLPEALRAWYRVAGRIDPLNRIHNRLFPPEDLAVEGDYLMFMDENQSVVSWGFRLDSLGDPDPVVWQLNNTPPASWNSEEKTFTTFLESMFDWYASTGLFQPRAG